MLEAVVIIFLVLIAALAAVIGIGLVAIVATIMGRILDKTKGR